MNILKDNGRIILAKPTKEIVIGECREMILPSGTAATVVLVHGDISQPKAYEN